LDLKIVTLLRGPTDAVKPVREQSVKGVAGIPGESIAVTPSGFHPWYPSAESLLPVVSSLGKEESLKTMRSVDPSTPISSEKRMVADSPFSQRRGQVQLAHL
jgi:hypothetical protein